ncbi:MAG TPA: rRNA maturation RNase YbeY [Pyrinomonadaceae bacterium]|jgi:probable rRNA maturation factor|nr:rRNA maturation RNase YbeY [Pyrinomonadaceae bacterium]
MVEIFNNQRKIKLDPSIFQTFAESAIKQIHEAENKTANIAFVSDRKMRALNNEFRGKNSTTDVLSFPFEADEFEDLSVPSALADGFSSNFLGDIVISLEQAQKQAAENDLDFETEIKQLILHGILHLCGYDHETDDGEMNRREMQLRKKLKID